MIIETIKEQLDEKGAVRSYWVNNQICVPKDPANTDYAEIMRQVEAGELTIAPADEEE